MEFKKEDEKEIIRLYVQEKNSINNIRKMFNCSYSWVYKFLNINNINTSKKGKSYEEIYGEERAKEMSKKIGPGKGHPNYNKEMKGCFEKGHSVSEEIRKKLREHSIEPERIAMAIKNLPRYKVGEGATKGNKMPEKHPLREYNKFRKDKTYEEIFGEEKAKLVIQNKIGRGSECKKGVKNPNWNNGSSFLPYPITFTKAFKLAIRQRDGFLCLKCGMREEDSLVLFKRKLINHHIDYVKENTIPENCCALCIRCNAEVNSNRQSWTKFFQSMLSERYEYKYSENGDIILKLNGVKL